jgi:hypothetical protein
MRQHVAQLVMEYGGIFGRFEVSVGFSPESPASGQTLKYLTRVSLSAQNRFPVRSLKRLALGIDLGHSRLSEIFLRQNIDRKLGPGFGDPDILKFEDGRPVGISNLRGPIHERQPFIGALATFGKSPFYPHVSLLTTRAAQYGGLIGFDVTKSPYQDEYWILCPLLRGTTYSYSKILSNKMLWILL